MKPSRTDTLMHEAVMDGGGMEIKMDKKWQALELYEIEKQLNTSLEGGLSIREARSRLEKETKQSNGERLSLFVPKRKKLFGALFAFFKAPCVIVLMILSLLSFALGASVGGLFVLLISVIGAMSCGIILMTSEKKQADMLESASPMVKVRRGGSIFYTDGRNAVVGDIIILSSGDLLPCDARIISSESLKVKELIHTKNGIRNRTVEKYAFDFSAEKETKTPDVPNMLYAGSAVISGDAVAVVVSTSENVYLAEYCKGSLLRTAAFSETDATRLDGIFRKFSFFSLISLIVLSLLSLLTMPKEGFLSVFLMITASISMISPMLVKTVKMSIYSSCLDRMARRSKKNGDTSAYVRDIKTVEALSELTDLVLLGKAAFTYGTSHIDALCICGERIEPNADNADVGRLMSYVYTYIKALEQSNYKTELVLDGVKDSLAEHLKSIRFDKKGTDLILSSLYFSPNGSGTGGYACAETPEGAYRLMLTYDRDMLSYCTYIRMKDQALASFAGSGREKLTEFEQSLNKGYGKCLYVISERNGEAVLEGALSLAETSAGSVGEDIEEITKLSVRVLPMISDEMSDELLSLNKAFSQNIAYAAEFKSKGYEVTYDFGKYTAYVGFSDDDHASLIDYMRKIGGTVAAYGIGDEHYGAMSHADVAISCDVLRYSSQKYRESVYEKMPQEGRDSNVRCSQKTRFLSRVLVHRANRSGGGLYSIRRAIKRARGANTALSRSLLYYASIMSMLLPLAAMSPILGIKLLNGIQTACLSVTAVILAANIFVDSDPRGESQRRIKWKSMPKVTWQNKYVVMLILRASVACIFAISVKLLDVFGVFGENASYSMPIFISLIFIAATELFFSGLSFSNRSDGKRRMWICFLSVYLSLLAVCGIITQDFVSKSIFPNGIGTYEFILVPVYLVLYIFVVSVLRLIQRIRKNS